MNRYFPAFTALAAALLLSACATGRVTVAYGTSPEELIQRAHEASDRNRFGHALQFYKAMLELFGDEPALAVNAKYEIGFIHERRRDFDEARFWLNAVLDLYAEPGGELLPDKFRVLALIVLERMGDSRARRQPRSVPAPIITGQPGT